MKREVFVGIEAAYGGGSLSVYSGRREVAVWTGSGRVSRSEELLFELDRLLREGDVGREDLAGLIVSVGGGSFTGTRIGLALAGGLSVSLGCPIFRQKVFSALENVYEDERKILAVSLNEREFCWKVTGVWNDLSETSYRGEPASFLEFLGGITEFSEGVAGALICSGGVFGKVPPRHRVRKKLKIIDAGENLAALLVRGFLDGVASDNEKEVYSGVVGYKRG
ncbi:MAG: hypothetical protein R2747_04700 [Pyrinomonadaceae bacterium]